MTQFSQPLADPMTSSSAPLLSSIWSGTTSIYPTRPSLPCKRIHTTGEQQSTLPSYTGMNLYESRHDLPLPQSRTTSLHQSSHHDEPQTDSPFQGGEGNPQDPRLRSQKSSVSTEGSQNKSERQSSGESMRKPEGARSPRSTVEEKPFTTPPQEAIPAPKDSPTKNMSMESLVEEAPLPRQSPPQLPRTLPQLTTPITIAWALYLLSTGKLVQTPAILSRATLGDLFNHFQKELLEDPNWAKTPAGMDYGYYGMNYILKEEAVHFTCTAYNMIHHDRQVEVPARYQRPQIDLPPIVYTLEPMEDKPPVPPQRAAVPDYPRWEPGYTPNQPSYAYPHGYGPPGTQGPSRLFAAALTKGEAGPSNLPQVPVPPPSKPQPPPPPPDIPQRWAPPRYPPPPGPPDPPAPWVLDAANLGPWASLKPEMVKVPDNFNGNSNDIARFFSQCDMYFSIFNQHFYYHPHKVIFCASRFGKDVQVWWELCA